MGRFKALAAVAAEKYTWMKYKGTTRKRFTRMVRGTASSTILEPESVYGIREVKQRATGLLMYQVVLKSEGLNAVYNVSSRSGKLLIKASRITVIPKALRSAELLVPARTTGKSPVVKTKKTTRAAEDMTLPPDDEEDYGLSPIKTKPKTSTSKT